MLTQESPILMTWGYLLLRLGMKQGSEVMGWKVKRWRREIDEAIVLTCTRYDYGIQYIRLTRAGLWRQCFRQNQNHNNDSVPETAVWFAVTCDHLMAFEHKILLTWTSHLCVSYMQDNKSAMLGSYWDILAFRRHTQTLAGFKAQSFSHASTNTYYVSYMGVLGFSSLHPTHPHTPLTVSSRPGMLGI